MEKKKRGRKTVRSKENEEFIKTVCNHFEIKKKQLKMQEERIKDSLKRVHERLLFQIPPDVLNTKLKDLPAETLGDTETHCKQKGTGKTRERSRGKIMDSGKRHTGVLHNRSLLQVATELNMLKSAGSNSLRQYIGTPSASSTVPSMGILRIPEPGEYAVSATGSPLLVSSSAHDTVNINIPLKNGKKIAILPNADLNPNAICDHLDPDVMSQLKQLTNTISMMLENA